MDKVMIISPHADDETIGCGGTILKHLKAGNEVTIVQVSHPGTLLYDLATIKLMNAQVERVYDEYKCEWTDLDYEYGMLSDYNIPQLVGDFINVLDKYKPNILFIPYHSDLQTDHQVVNRAIVAAAKMHRHPYIDFIAMYETLSETENSPLANFQPNYFVDISDEILTKLMIFKLYKTEIQEQRTPKNLLALARFRGAQVNREYCESFMILREVK
jgi:LmbE family N-acetylglucosaminyl deacetylase